MKRTCIPILLAAVTACSDDAGTADAPGATGTQAYIVAGDFRSGDPGVMARIDPATAAVTKMVAPAGAVDNDPLLRHLGDRLAIINRSDNNITLLDDTTLAVAGQFATGDGSDPQDAALVGDTLFVPTLFGPGVVTIDTTTGATGAIDLSADDPDGAPNCASILAIGTRLYVACGLLDGASHPRGAGKIYVVDATTRAQDGAATITLTTPNPITLLEQAPAAGPLHGQLVVGTVDFQTDNSGCVEVVPVDGTSTGATCLVDNAAIGGFVGRLAFATDTLWYTATRPGFAEQLLGSYDLAAGAVVPPVSPAAQSPNDVAACPGDRIIYTDEAQTGGGVRLRDATGTEVTAAAALDVGLAPKSSHGLVCF